MLINTKCAQCKKLITTFNAQLTKTRLGSDELSVLALVCPECSTIIGAQVNPVLIATDIVEKLFQKLRAVG